MNCPFASVNGKKFGGAAERAELLDEFKQAYREMCR